MHRLWGEVASQLRLLIIPEFLVLKGASPVAQSSITTPIPDMDGQTVWDLKSNLGNPDLVWKGIGHMNLHTLALVGVLGVFGVSVEAQTCGVLCGEDFWKSASQADVVQEILTADVNARDGDGRTALMWAASMFGTAPESVRVLLDAGADVNARDTYGNTALILAAGFGTTENMEFLLDAGHQ